MSKRLWVPAFVLALAGCEMTIPDEGNGDGGSSPSTDAGRGDASGGAKADGGTADGGRATDGGVRDGGATADGGHRDGGSARDAGTPDGGEGDLTVWPNEVSKANSDDWLVQNHDAIRQLQPRVLAIDIGNTSNPNALIQKHIDAIAFATSHHRFKDTNAHAAVLYKLVKVVKASSPDYGKWNTQSFADSNIQIKDPANPSGRNLTLCELFEKGLINEVWCMATQSQTKCGETQETKQVYANTDPPHKVPGRLVDASNGDDITFLGCKVSTRIIDFNTSRGAGCHLHAMGHAWERYMDSSAIPLLRKQASRFLNWDLDTRLGAPFRTFYDACNSNGSQLTDCMVWSSETAMHSGPSASSSFSLADVSGGCGNAHFYPNTTGTYSYDALTPDPKVLCSCEHYGLHDGANGKDATNEYTNAMTDTYANASPVASDDDCGGHGTTYLYQNMPGPGTTAKNDDSTPMHDWWVYLFY